MKRVLGFLLAGGLLPAFTFLQAAPPAYLTIGDPAPSLAGARWIKGTPVPAFQKGRLYAVEFWATWCGPCKQSIPHLTELARTYKGKVSFIGMDIWETVKTGGGDPLPKVKAFVKEQGKRMGYTVGADVPEGTLASAWMKPAGENGIPCAFVVDGEGKVAWIGHPAALEDVLKAEVAGTWDREAARAKRQTALEITRPIAEATEAKDYPRLITLTEAVLEKQPEKKPNLAYGYLQALYHVDLEKGKRVSRQILEESNQDLGAYQMMLAIFAVSADLAPEAYAFGRTLVAEVEAKGVAHPMFLAMVADIEFNAGDRAESIALGEAALAAARKDPHEKPETVALIERNLQKHRAAGKP